MHKNNGQVTALPHCLCFTCSYITAVELMDLIGRKLAITAALTMVLQGTSQVYINALLSFL